MFESEPEPGPEPDDREELVHEIEALMQKIAYMESRDAGDKPGQDDALRRMEIALRAESTVLRGTISSLKATIASQKATAFTLKATIAELTDATIALQNERAALAAEIATMKSKVAARRAKLAELKEQTIETLGILSRSSIAEDTPEMNALKREIANLTGKIALLESFQVGDSAATARAMHQIEESIRSEIRIIDLTIGEFPTPDATFCPPPLAMWDEMVFSLEPDEVVEELEDGKPKLVRRPRPVLVTSSVQTGLVAFQTIGIQAGRPRRPVFISTLVAIHVPQRFVYAAQGPRNVVLSRPGRTLESFEVVDIEYIPPRPIVIEPDEATMEVIRDLQERLKELAQPPTPEHPEKPVDVRAKMFTEMRIAIIDAGHRIIARQNAIIGELINQPPDVIHDYQIVTVTTAPVALPHGDRLGRHGRKGRHRHRRSARWSTPTLRRCLCRHRRG
jgi:hypothetical protein